MKKVQFLLESESKRYGNPSNRITGVGHDRLYRYKQNGVSVLKKWMNVTGSLCNNYTRRVGQFDLDNKHKKGKKRVPVRKNVKECHS